MPGWPAAAVEPERRQLLEVDPNYVRFRHELARHAIRSSVPSRGAAGGCTPRSSRRCSRPNADPADIVHHAEAAGADGRRRRLRARRRAARGGAGLEPRGVLALPARRRLRRPAAAAEQAVRARGAGRRAAYAVGRLDDAFAGDRAGDRDLRASSATRRPSAGARASSRGSTGTPATATPRGATAREAIAILEPLGESVELARAYSGLLAARDARRGRRARRSPWGERALELATRLGDERTRAHALVNIGTAQLQLDHRDVGALLEAHAVADAAGDRHEATRALVNLGYTLMCWVRPDEALPLRASGRSRTRAEHEVHTLASVHRHRSIAWLRLRAGEWDEAERLTRARARERRDPSRSCSRRRCWPSSRSAAATTTPPSGSPTSRAQADRTGELQRIAPALELAAEWALTTGAPMPTERFEQLARGDPAARAARRLERDARRGLGRRRRHRRRRRRRRCRRRTRRCCARDWRAAADAFGEVGWTYDRALMLSLLDDEEALAEAIEIARGLGAEPLDAARHRRACASSASASRAGRARRRARTRPG